MFQIILVDLKILGFFLKSIKAQLISSTVKNVDSRCPEGSEPPRKHYPITVSRSLRATPRPVLPRHGNEDRD